MRFMGREPQADRAGAGLTNHRGNIVDVCNYNRVAAIDEPVGKFVGYGILAGCNGPRQDYQLWRPFIGSMLAKRPTVPAPPSYLTAQTGAF